jgi:hypothetical protein
LEFLGLLAKSFQFFDHFGHFFGGQWHERDLATGRPIGTNEVGRGIR